MRQQLKEKIRRIAELERQIDGADPYNRSLEDVFNSSQNTNGSVGSGMKSTGDPIWQRLQKHLDEAREELAVKEELLRTHMANLVLQTDRVAELEYELRETGSDIVKKLRDECKQLREEKKGLEDQIQLERKEAEDRMQKKDEALVYFRNELQKLKETPITNDPQRALLDASRHSRQQLMDDSSVHSTASSTVQRAFGGLSSFVSPKGWGRNSVDMDTRSIATPKLDDDDDD